MYIGILSSPDVGDILGIDSTPLSKLSVYVAYAPALNMDGLSHNNLQISLLCPTPQMNIPW